MRPDDQTGRVNYSTFPVTLRCQPYQFGYFDRAGTGRTMVYIHGLGCSKSDFLPMTQDSRLDSFRLLSFDHPGCGDTPYDLSNGLGIDDLVQGSEAFVSGLGLNQFVLVGHSMGGLIGLLYAERNPARVIGFVNVEGNLASEDCFLSRRVTAHDYSEFEAQVFPENKKSLAERKGLGFARYLNVLASANPRAYYDYCFQMVEYSDRGNLLERFLSLPIPKCFVYGAENQHLSYLPRLRQSNCKVIEIADANHFPFHDNPDAFAAALASFP